MHFKGLQHNKVLIAKRNGAAVKVLFGSTNFSFRGLYIQANNALVFRDAGAAGLFAKGSSVVLGPGITQAEGWLWQTELDGSVALAATCLPPGAKKSAARGASMGRLVPDLDQVSLKRRDQLRREAEDDAPP